MESNGPRNRRRPRRRLRDLVSMDMIWLAWLPVVAISVFHYATGAHHHWAHDVLRRLYYIPILFAAFSRGIWGGVAVALISSLAYAPHAFLLMEHSQDPATTLNKVLEIVLYNAMGLLAGVLADREARRRQQAEQAYADQRRMADQLVRAGRLAALGELVAGIAHEIRNPLHTIKGTAEVIDEVIPRDAEQASMWTVLRQEIDRLEGIAERFLSFARPSEPELREQPFGSVHERMAQLLRAQTHKAPEVRLEIVPLYRTTKECRVCVDRDQLAQIVLNIAANALRSMQEGGILRLVSARRRDPPDAWLTLRLENDGPTIAAGDLERIFDPFFTRADDGTGLGLAIAERIAEGHGGYLEVENTGVERGVAFTLVLPEVDSSVTRGSLGR